MARDTIQAAIKTILETVTDIGQVHDSIRWTIHEDKFIKNFFTVVNEQQQIRTWMIYRVDGAVDYGAREGSLGTSQRIPTQSSFQRYDFAIEGWASFKDDETDIEFQSLIDSVIDKFQANISLNNTSLMRGPITYSIDHQFFGDYFVHHVIFNFYATEREGITPT